MFCNVTVNENEITIYTNGKGITYDTTSNSYNDGELTIAAKDAIIVMKRYQVIINGVTYHSMFPLDRTMELIRDSGSSIISSRIDGEPFIIHLDDTTNILKLETSPAYKDVAGEFTLVDDETILVGGHIVEIYEDWVSINYSSRYEVHSANTKALREKMSLTGITVVDRKLFIPGIKPSLLELTSIEYNHTLGHKLETVGYTIIVKDKTVTYTNKESGFTFITLDIITDKCLSKLKVI